MDKVTEDLDDEINEVSGVMLKNEAGLKEDHLEIHIFLPILPGRGEAWRRFAQELSGPRREEWAGWRERIGAKLLQGWISAGQMGAGVYLRARLDRPDGGLILFNQSEPFDRWLREQVFSLHGLDLAQLQEYEMWESVLI